MCTFHSKLNASANGLLKHNNDIRVVYMKSIPVETLSFVKDNLVELSQILESDQAENISICPLSEVFIFFQSKYCARICFTYGSNCIVIFWLFAGSSEARPGFHVNKGWYREQ